MGPVIVFGDYIADVKFYPICRSVIKKVTADTIKINSSDIKANLLLLIYLPSCDTMVKKSIK